mgnify:CR=1 FL=1
MVTQQSLRRMSPQTRKSVTRPDRTIRRWIVQSRIERRKRQAMERLSPRLRRDVGFDRHAV